MARVGGLGQLVQPGVTHAVRPIPAVAVPVVHGLLHVRVGYRLQQLLANVELLLEGIAGRRDVLDAVVILGDEEDRRQEGRLDVLVLNQRELRLTTRQLLQRGVPLLLHEVQILLATWLFDCGVLRLRFRCLVGWPEGRELLLPALPRGMGFQLATAVVLRVVHRVWIEVSEDEVFGHRRASHDLERG